MNVLEQLATKAQVTGDVGDSLDKELEAAEADVHRLQGGAHWLLQSIKGVSGLVDHIRKDFEENKFDGLDGKAIHDLLIDYNRKAIECIQNLAEQKKAEGLAVSGRVSGLKRALEVVTSAHKAATTQATQILKSIESNEPLPDEAEAKAARRERAPGEHPGPSALDARRVAALKAEFAQSSEANPQAAEALSEESAPLATVTPIPAVEPKKSRKTRKKSASNEAAG